MKRPVSCEWNITNYCNLKCSFCSMNCTNQNDFENLNISKIKEVARKIKEVGCIYVSLSGGEPMSHPLFFDIVKELREQRIEVTLTTNGTFINADNIKLLEKLGVKWIQISLHGGDPDINNSIMGGNSYSAIRKSIEVVKASSIGVSVSSVITDKNEASIRKLNEELEMENIPHIIRKLMLVGRAALVEKELDINEEVEIERVNENCGLFFAIATNGDIQPCGEFKVRLGNVFEDDLIDIWKNSVLLKMCSKDSRCLAEIYENNGKFRKQIKSMI